MRTDVEIVDVAEKRNDGKTVEADVSFQIQGDADTYTMTVTCTAPKPYVADDGTERLRPTYTVVSTNNKTTRAFAESSANKELFEELTLTLKARAAALKEMH